MDKMRRIVQIRGLNLNSIQKGGQLKLTIFQTLTGSLFGLSWRTVHTCKFHYHFSFTLLFKNDTSQKGVKIKTVKLLNKMGSKDFLTANSL